ncbi:hypothetical protein D3C72_1706510 [compost metagenome]
MSNPMPNFLAVALMMRKLAWCGTSQSSSLGSMPAAARVSVTISLRRVTATLNTSLPFIYM